MNSNGCHSDLSRCGPQMRRRPFLQTFALLPTHQLRVVSVPCEHVHRVKNDGLVLTVATLFCVLGSQKMYQEK